MSAEVFGGQFKFEHNAPQALDWDTATLEAVYDVQLNIDPPSTVEEYDECRSIASEMLAAAQGLRDRTAVFARNNLKMQITDEQLVGWRPSLAEAAKLRRDLTRHRKTLRIIKSIGEYIEDQEHEAIRLGVPLRPHQRKVLEDTHHFIRHETRTTRAGGKSGLIEMATGTGKTCIFANITAAVKHNEDPDNPARVLVIVPTQQILDQTMGRHGERGFGKFTPHLDVGAFYEDEKDLSHDVTVVCAASFNNLMRAGVMPHFDVVIVDEAHKMIGDASAENLRNYCDDKLSIGLTATAEYDEERSAYALFKHTISKMSMPDAVRWGLLAPVRAYLREAEPNIDPRTLPADPQKRKISIRRARLEARMQAAVDVVRQELERGVGVVVRCPAGDDIDCAVRFAEMVNGMLVHAGEELYGMKWVVARYVGGSAHRQTKEDRHLMLEGFDRGMIDVVCYVKALGIGWDSPNAKALINLAPTSSTVEELQALGRVLRLVMDRKRRPVEAHAYDFVDPDLGDSQYTALKALCLQEGELLDHDQSEMPIPAPRTGNKTASQAEIIDIEERVVGTAALASEVDIVWPSQSELDATILVQGGDTLVPIDEAVRILGISLPTLRGMLRDLWSSPDHLVTLADIRDLIEMYPDLQAPPLPNEGEGYIEAHELSQTLPTTRIVRLFSMMRFARVNGYNPQRFTGPDGKIRFYFDSETAFLLVEAMAEQYFKIP